MGKFEIKKGKALFPLFQFQIAMRSCLLRQFMRHFYDAKFSLKNRVGGNVGGRLPEHPDPVSTATILLLQIFLFSLQKR